MRTGFKRLAIAVVAVLLSLNVAGCAAGALAELAPLGASVGQAAVIGVAEKASGGGEDNKEEQTEVCEGLAKATPGVEELRKTHEGVIMSRQWRLTEHNGSPAWVVVHTNTAPQDGWEPRSGLAKLQFTPRLADMLVPDEPEFLAYAPSIAESTQESDQMAALTSAFGANDGTFQWRGRTYTFSMIKQLPCFKPEKAQ